MLISELSQKTSFSKDTIRFYEKAGLLGQPEIQRKQNNYRQYNQMALNRLWVIADLKEFGFTLAEIVEMVNLYESNPAACPENIPKIQSKIETLNQKIMRLNAFRDRLQGTLNDCQSDCENSCGLDKTLRSLTVPRS